MLGKAIELNGMQLRSHNSCFPPCFLLPNRVISCEFRVVDEFDRLRCASHVWNRRPNNFETLYLALKRCFPVPDYVLAAMLGVTAGYFSEWCRGRFRPSRTTRRLVIFLCLHRIGRLETLDDLVHAGRIEKTGKLEKLIDAHLAHEREVLARRAAKKAAKEAATSTKSSTTPDATA